MKKRGRTAGVMKGREFSPRFIGDDRIHVGEKRSFNLFSSWTHSVIIHICQTVQDLTLNLEFLFYFFNSDKTEVTS